MKYHLLVLPGLCVLKNAISFLTASVQNQIKKFYVTQPEASNRLHK